MFKIQNFDKSEISNITSEKLLIIIKNYIQKKITSLWTKNSQTKSVQIKRRTSTFWKN